VQKPKLDKYYTTIHNIEAICNILYENCPKNIEMIIEPSAGDGRIIKKLQKIFPEKKIIGFDISPDNKNIIKLDFLKEKIDKYTINDKKKTLIVGNPPYGKNNTLAIEFIKKSSEYANNIFFILPNSFKSDRYKKLLNKYNLRIKKVWKIPENIFEYKNKKYRLYTSFFWITYCNNCSDVENEDNNKITRNILIYTKNKKEAKFLIRRVGGLAGKIIENGLEKYSLNSNYFIKKCDNNIKNFLKKNFKKLNNIAKENVVSNPSLSKKKLEEFILKHYFK